MTDNHIGKLNQDQINFIKEVHKTKGLKLAFTSGLEGGITKSHELIISLLGMAEENLELTKKVADLESGLSPITENRKIIIEAYGILWRQSRSTGFTHDARKVLLSDLTQDEKREGVNMAIKKYGPLRLDELPKEEQALIDPESFHSNQGTG